MLLFITVSFLSLISVMFLRQGQMYQLYAFVEHFGDLRKGHYTVTIKSPDDEQWYNFNDTVVTLVRLVNLYSVNLF